MRQILGFFTLTVLVACSAADAPSSGGSGGYGGGYGGSTATSATGNDDAGSNSGTGAGSSQSGGGGNGNGGATSAAPDAGSSGWKDAGGTPSTGGSGNTGTVDAGTTSAPSVPAAPTWTQIYSRYLASGTMGNCESCHSQAATASGAYGFLASYIDGTQSNLGAIFSWMGGAMPPGGASSNAKASADVEAWVAAGALDN